MANDEVRERLVKILNDVDEVHQKEAQLQSEKERLKEQIKKDEDDLRTCDASIKECRDNELLLKDQMDEIHKQLFDRPQETTPTTENETSNDERDIAAPSLAKRKWDEEVKRRRMNAV
jgi:septal ring factor EnvC (AmiA/AmiB activator)